MPCLSFDRRARIIASSLAACARRGKVSVAALHRVAPRKGALVGQPGGTKRADLGTFRFLFASALWSLLSCLARRSRSIRICHDASTRMGTGTWAKQIQASRAVQSWQRLRRAAAAGSSGDREAAATGPAAASGAFSAFRFFSMASFAFFLSASILAFAFSAAAFAPAATAALPHAAEGQGAAAGPERQLDGLGTRGGMGYPIGLTSMAVAIWQ